MSSLFACASQNSAALAKQDASRVQNEDWL